MLEVAAPFLQNPTSASALEELLTRYEVRETAARLQAAHHVRVALQFPDEYLPDAPAVCAVLDALLGGSASVFVLGDTSYGACCADEVAAQHLAADAIAHYGPACLSPTRELPVLYIFPGAKSAREKVLEHVSQALAAVCSQTPEAARVVVLYDAALAPALACASLETELVPVPVQFALPVMGDLEQFVQPLADGSRHAKDGKGVEAGAGCIHVSGLQFSVADVPIEDTAVLWACADGAEALPPALRNAALLLASGMSGSCRAMFKCGADGGDVSEVNGGKIFRMRAREVSRAQSAERIGVVAASPGVAGVTDAIDRAVRVIEDAEKRAYVLLVGKIAPPKLLNFEEMDAFVVVSCPLLVIMDSKEYMVPVLTPLELEIALGIRDMYSETYSADFRDLAVEAAPDGGDASEGETTVAERGDLKVAVASPGGAAEFFKKREWQGLVRGKGGRDENTSLDELSTKVVQGSSGIATAYVGETGKSKDQDR